jgi:hypothetical protein
MSVLRSAMLLTLFSSAYASAQQWSAQRVLSIGENQGIEFAEISAIALTPDGGFFVLDRQHTRVYGFSTSGKLVRSFGTRGAGPGELSQFTMDLLYTNGQLAVIDALNQRISLFTPDGTLVHSRPLPFLEGMPMGWAVAGNRLLYLSRALPGPLGGGQRTTTTKHAVLSLDPRGNAPADTLLRVELPADTEMGMTGSSIRLKMNLRVPRLQLVGDGKQLVLLAQSDTYRIRVMTEDGKTANWLSRNITRHRYTGAELASIRQSADSTMNVAMARGAAAAGGARGVPRPEVEYVLPEYAPAVSALIAGDAFVLVSRTPEAEQSKPTDWDILGYDNRLLGTIRLPARFQPRALLRDRLYGIEKDELDVQSVAIFRIAR